MEGLELCYMSAGDLARLVKRREVSPVEIVEAHLARIDATDPVLNSFITLLPDEARAAAQRAEREIQAGAYRGPLHGIPVGLKDLYNTAGVRTTSGSRIFDTFIPSEDCTVAARFREAGAILLGKLNLHQFAFGPTGENPDYGHMHNPWNPELIAGGSSGGSGSATAAGQCTITTGSDTGGSIRIPAALCGIVGLKPTYGLVSRYGLTPLSWSLDHPGPMVRTVEDAALAMNAIAGHDTERRGLRSGGGAGLHHRADGLPMALGSGACASACPAEYFQVPLDPQVERAVREAITLMESMGAEVTEVSFPMFHDAQAISGAILVRPRRRPTTGTCCWNRATSCTRPVRLRLEAGLFITAADYLRAQQARTLFNRQARELMEHVDLLAGPTEPVTAPQLLAAHVQAGEEEVGTTCGVNPVHPSLQHHRLSRHHRPLRFFRRGTANRTTASGAFLRRVDGASGRPCLRASHRLAQTPPANLA